ncbi:hypothetical protein DOU07_03180 [Clavibacter michiganensis subsp. michiganensis]|nr:hypothetical protein [Clavibacter michiganensis subsp. michiganensis]MWJ13008.1 hypothetical protein [Clavibacter michiganensis subsp. michiganensis]MWJ37076.1 hypothetical protein [Clavibacter michiganensis subsp. michiganensis]MWJ40464.1 hypothetical protein [Clavibacter michiganensis subsp. michiganensis]MWJ47771.1 hypothetical protein [Clavibacter michiganensis subsp. michiganensis]
MRSHPRAAIVVLLVLASSMALAGCASGSHEMPPSPTSSHPADPAISGIRGAAHFDEGFVQIGDGDKVVDIYLDAMCPHCREFEETSLSALLSDAAAGRAEIRVHPVAILDRLSSGSRYSTRAAADVVDVAVHHPDSVGSFLETLFAHQPEEGGSGLTDAQLGDLVRDATGEAASERGERAAYRMWVESRTAMATTGPLAETEDIPRLQGVPTVLVDGELYEGAGADGPAFSDFYSAY